MQAEGEALAALDVRGSIISLTGSNPMHDQGMTHVARSGRNVCMAGLLP